MTQHYQCEYCEAEFYDKLHIQSCDDNGYWLLTWHTQEHHKDKLFTCDRRGVGPQDYWINGDRCSYCGSMSGERFMDAVEAGAVITPTDKSYKVYINDSQKFYFQHLTAEQQARFIELHNSKKMNLAFPGYFYTTPYFCV